VDFRSPGEGLGGADRVKAITEERRTILALLAALGAAIGLYYTHLRHELDRDSNRTDRYTKAVEQLGHDSSDVQLGGIYALERIALDSVRDRAVISEVLSAFIRERAKPDPSRTDLGPEVDPRSMAGPTTVVQAALTVLGRRPANDRTYPRADLNQTWLPGANLTGANLAGANLAGANLTGANLTGANLSGAILMGATFTHADLSGADLTVVNLNGAKITHASLGRANLSGASLGWADLTSTQFTLAQLDGANLYGANLTDTNLTDEQWAVTWQEHK
jgi:hypothetical protein